MSSSPLPWLASPSYLPSKNWTAVATLFGVLVSLNLLGKIIRSTVLVPKLTIKDDLPKVGLRRADGKIRGRAVVCGGSVAGLSAAAVCADHFESVLIIEAEGSPDKLGMDRPKATEFRTMEDGPNTLRTPIPLRKRLIQYLALHGNSSCLVEDPSLLHTPTSLLPRIWPMRNLRASKAISKPPASRGGLFWMVVSLPLSTPSRTTAHTNTKVVDPVISFVPSTFVLSFSNKLTPEVFTTRDPRTPIGLSVSREAFETLLRRLVVKSRPNISFITGTVDGFKRQAHDNRHLSAVTVRDQEEQPATFIVDATGPAQSSYHKWLKNSGFDLPASLQDEYDPCLSYAQSVYTLPDKLLPEIEKLFIHGLTPGSVWSNAPEPSTGEARMLYMYWTEDSNRLMIVCGGWGATKEQRPHGIDEIREYTKSLRNAEATPQWIFKLYDLLEQLGEECSPWFADYHPGKMSLIKYHEAPQGTLPSNWVAMGDAIVKLNPIYGQGCGKAMMDVVTLDSLLRHVPSQQDLPLDFSEKFFQKTIARTGGMWDGNKANDYGFPTTHPAKGETLEVNAFARAFGRNFLYAGLQSHKVQTTFIHITAGLVPRTDAFAPSILIRVAWQWLKELTNQRRA
ncbi:hypothetical protein FRB98_009565 [Tulasnella sp. 332]|nr:hypothetical protein FRB98_009565 [Tulasnella sp. 332]